MKFDYLKKIVSWTILTVTIGLFNPANVSVNAMENTEKTNENCHTMTEEWFGDGIQTYSMNGNDETENVLSEYFSSREQDFSGITLFNITNEESLLNENIQEEIQQRREGIITFQQKAGIQITDVEATTIYQRDDIVLNDDGTKTVFLYEWTFFDYDDLSDDTESIDVSGYGTYHKITLEENNGEYVIVSDEYDESELFGICTMNDTTEDELSEMDYELYDIDSEIRAMMVSSYGMYDSYNPDAAAEYADRYVYTGATSGDYNYEGYYNSAYYNFNSLGGDCANYTSQCIYAGGMPQVVGSQYGTNGWFYKTSTDRSATWTGAAYLETWMANNRGNSVTASDSTVYKGSPVFYNSAHATICVGKNSAGVPIINSHNFDRYHVKWNYWGSGTTYTTVQLTNGDKSYPFRSYIDSPTSGSTWENSVLVDGWAILGDGITNVTGWANGHSFNVPLYQRNDVANAYPGYPTGNEGFKANIPIEYLQNGKNTLDLYAYHNTDAYHIGSVEFTVKNLNAPIITDIKITDVSDKGYTITCNVKDDKGISYVKLPTWTEKNGQDDLDFYWITNEKYSGKIEGNKVTYYVKASEHNGESGLYHTHIYAYDSDGNKTVSYVSANIGEKTLTPQKTIYFNNNKYEVYPVYESWISWSAAKTFAESLGGHLATITSAEEQKAIEGLFDASVPGYYIGGTDEENEGTWKWITGEAFSYTNWAKDEPNNSNGLEHYLLVRTADKKWNDDSNDNKDVKNAFIVEYEVIHSHSYTGVVTKVPTCTEKGVKTYTCECEDSYTEDIPMIKHNYKNGSCTECGTKDPDYVPTPEVNPTAPQIIVDTLTASAGETVDVKISLKNNPGIASMKLKVSYDSILTLESVTYNSKLGGQSQQPQNTSSPVTLNWFNGTANSVGDVVYATLNFKISDTAKEGTEAQISVSYNPEDVFDIVENNIEFTVVNGFVGVISYVPGDINGDKVVNNKDLTRLFQYLSEWDVEVVENALDVNGDGNINNKDLTRLFQYLSEWDVEIC